MVSKMKFIVKTPTGAAYDYELEEMRRDFNSGKLSPECTVRREDSTQWVPIRAALGLQSEGEPEFQSVAPAATDNPTGFQNSDFARGCLMGGVIVIVLLLLLLLFILRSCSGHVYTLHLDFTERSNM